MFDSLKFLFDCGVERLQFLDYSCAVHCEIVVCVFVPSCSVLKLLNFEPETPEQIFLAQFKLFCLAFVVANITDPVLVQLLIRTCLATGHYAQTAIVVSKL